MEGAKQQKDVPQPPVQPISLRILFAEDHQWLKVDTHLSVCPGNGCSVDVCLYIRALCAHEIDQCPEYCSWCSKVRRWLRYHARSCKPKKCPYNHFCNETQKKFFRRRMTIPYSEQWSKGPTSSLHSSASESSVSSGSIPVGGAMGTTRHSITAAGPGPSSTCRWGCSEEAKCCESGNCCHEPHPHDMASPSSSSSSLVLSSSYITSSYSQDIIQRALDERLPETETEVKAYIETKKQIRLALLERHKFYQEGVHWERIKQLGCGSSGTTYCIRDRETSFWLALKEEQESLTAVNETLISLRLSSSSKDHPPNIVEFYGASLLPLQVETKLQLFLELMPCCLQSYLYNGGPLSVEDAHNYACQLFDALDYLHGKINLVHSDIKPGNLLIDENVQRLKVTDFGCSQVLEDSHQGYCMRGDANAGTVHYNPPEHYSEFRCSYALDIWQAGCCIIAMVTGRRPWRSMYLDCRERRYRAEVQQSQIQQICKVPYSHHVPGFLDPALQQLVQQCLSIDYRRRPSLKDCLGLLAQSDVVSDSCKGQWLSHLGLQPTCFSSSSSPAPKSFLVDIYLGSYVHYSHYSLLPGWLGSVSCDSHVTYSQLHELIRNSIPVTQLFRSMEFGLCDNLPNLIWQKSSINHGTSDTTSEDIIQLSRPKGTDAIDSSKGVVVIVE
ncbi:PREDICTED: spindle assembly checkpoint kinase-like [Amphimedon queenslandica]|uniref:mitogen-activated protein kinase kinase n=1 Tax=Amphimedon queenslandica TaxID=400682 RepID=A0A1X7VH54_AMPQE|nr:PREDICTED: spindle assembly checkpoint kinase-like [Amphimedon queenslandica]|eukprot:XP_019848854.1 PREDICTED: spindle assembly checkpoint kinase-like [Amphimedon queenslandica]